MTKVSAFELLNEWQERLGLHDWSIALTINLKFEDLDLEDALAETTTISSIKNATIKIVDEKLNEGRTMPFDFEKILVHELLHVKFAIIEGNVHSYESAVLYEIQHQLIDDMASALVMAKRGEIFRPKLQCEKVRSGKDE